MLRIILACALAVIFAMPARAQSVDPYIGTWKLNLEKTTFVGAPVPKSFTLTYSAEGQNFIATLDQVYPEGRQNKMVFTMNFDGQPHPTTGSSIFDAATSTRFGNTIHLVYFKNGKAVAIGQYSCFGQLTYTGEGINANGQPYHLNLVYDRQ
jgi:hypothetical protein